MKTSNWVVTEGSTVEDAVKTALDSLQATEDEVEVVVEEPPRKGLFGLWQWRARVRVRRVEQSPLGADSEVSMDERAAHSRIEEKEPVQDATITVQRGKVHVTAPEGRAGDPVIRPGKHTRVWVNDQLVEDLQMVTAQDTIRVEAVDKPPETIVNVQISEDQFTADISVVVRPGVRYRLVDAPPAGDVTVTAEPDGVLPPRDLTVADLEAALAEHGVVYGISTEALEQVIKQIELDPAEAEKPVSVAFGIPMEPAVDEQVELLFEPAAQVRTVLEDHRADLLGLYKLSSVQAGDVLGIKQPGSKGKPGRTVTGKEVPVSEPREAQLTAGEGVAWDNAGQRLLATRGGRPTKIRNAIAVHPQHSVRGDVDPTTGHIEFDGDVVVTGNVSDSMRVISKGTVSVGNSVSNALVEADESVTVGRGIVKSKVVAGARYSRLFQVMGFLQPLAQDLRNLIKAVEQLKSDPRSGTIGFQHVTDGSLVKRLLDDKFSGVVQRIRELQELILGSDAERMDKELVQFASTLHSRLVGLGPLSLSDLSELGELQQQTEVYVADFKEQQTAAFDVVTDFVDNSEVVAGGRIIFQGGGCSYSRLWAGTGVVMDSGIFRGTTITVNSGDVTVKEAGSRAAAPARIEIVTEGLFRAGIVHPGVVVTIGNRRHAFRNEERDVRVRLVDGELQVRTGG